jgi:hypothetical protein
MPARSAKAPARGQAQNAKGLGTLHLPYISGKCKAAPDTKRRHPPDRQNARAFAFLAPVPAATHLHHTRRPAARLGPAFARGSSARGRVSRCRREVGPSDEEVISIRGEVSQPRTAVGRSRAPVRGTRGEVSATGAAVSLGRAEVSRARVEVSRSRGEVSPTDAAPLCAKTTTLPPLPL